VPVAEEDWKSSNRKARIVTLYVKRNPPFIGKYMSVQKL
jgi:hypothetical protein